LEEVDVSMSWKKILKGKSGIAYSAIVLDEASREKLLALDIPDGWTPYAHHMTIRMGSLKEDSQYTIGEEIKLNMTGVGRDEKAMAVTVDGVREDGKFFPHITVAVSPDGKPFNSNKIPPENFEDFSGTLTGIVTEVPQ